MPNVFKAATVGAACLMSLAHPSPLAAEPEAEQASEGTVTIYNLDSAGTPPAWQSTARSTRTRRPTPCS